MIISQSLTKSFGYYVVDDMIISQDYCPLQIYHKEILKDTKIESDAMMIGNYGEYKCLKSVGARGNFITDLPRKNLTKKQTNENIVRKAEGKRLIKGAKKIDQIRVDAQIERFSELTSSKQIIINKSNVHIPLISKVSDDIYISGELDIFPTTIMTEAGLALTIIDLKFTADVNNSFFSENRISSGYSCYANPRFLIKNQALFYHWLVRNINFDIIKEKLPKQYDRIKSTISDNLLTTIKTHGCGFTLLVLGYKKDITKDSPQYKILHVKWDNKREALFKKLVNLTVKSYKNCLNDGWVTNPKYNLCLKCPVKDCKKRIIDIVI